MLVMSDSARTGTRTRTPLRERDFKSLASTRFAIPANKKRGPTGRPSLPTPLLDHRAGNGTRTRDPNLGKVVLYQLSYSRKNTRTRKLHLHRTRKPHQQTVSTNTQLGMETSGIEPLTS